MAFLHGGIKEMQNLGSCLYHWSPLRDCVVICKVEISETPTLDTYIDGPMKSLVWRPFVNNKAPEALRLAKVL